MDDLHCLFYEKTDSEVFKTENHITTESSTSTMFLSSRLAVSNLMIQYSEAFSPINIVVSFQQHRTVDTVSQE